MKQGSCLAGEKILDPVSIPFVGCLKHQAVNLIQPKQVLFTNPSARAGYDTRSIFKQSLTGFEFRVFLLLD